MKEGIRFPNANHSKLGTIGKGHDISFQQIGNRSTLNNA